MAESLETTQAAMPSDVAAAPMSVGRVKAPRTEAQLQALSRAREKAFALRAQRMAEKKTQEAAQAQEAAKAKVTPPTPAPSPATEAPPPATEETQEEEEEVVEEIIKRPSKKARRKRVIRVVESSSSDGSDVEIRLPKRSKEKAAQSNREAAEQQRFNAAYSKLFDI